MKKVFLLSAATALIACQGGPGEVTNLKDTKEKVSYSIGLNIGRNFEKQGVEIDPDILAAGIRHGLSDKEALLTDEEIRQVMTQFQQEMMAKQQEQMQQQQAPQDSEAAAENQKKSEAFLAEQAEKEGVKKTDSGLLYEVVEEGKGDSPTAEDIVVVHYKGTLPDGKEFDSSYKRGEPAQFPVSGVIPGWTEALQLMKPGAKYKLYIPPELAYGPRGAGADIGPNQALVFEVELVSVNPEGAQDQMRQQQEQQRKMQQQMQEQMRKQQQQQQQQAPE